MVEIGIVMFSKVIQSENSKKKLERGADPCQGPNMPCPAKYARENNNSCRIVIIHEVIDNKSINEVVSHVAKKLSTDYKDSHIEYYIRQGVLEFK